MDKRDALFDLIKSLSKSEKRYFKLWTSRNGSKEDKYLQLFDAVEKQKIYDEHKMLQSKKLSNGVIKNFRFNKHYLYNLILRSLNSFHSESSVDAELKDMLHTVEVLNEKGLFEQCKKIVLKGKKISEKYENYLCHLNFLKWEINLMDSNSHLGITQAGLKKAYKQVFEVLKKHGDLNKYSMLITLSTIDGVKKGVARNAKERKAIQNIQDMDLGNSKNEMDETKLSYGEKEIIYFHKHKLARLNEDVKMALYYLQCLEKLTETKPHRIKEHPLRYISTLDNLIACKRILNHYDIDETIKKFKQIPLKYGIKSARIKNIIFYRACNLELNNYIHTGEFKKGLIVVNDILNQQKRSHLKVNNKEREIVLYYNMALIFFGVEKYASANLYLNKIINDTTSDLRSDIYSYARILQLITHYEMGNQELIDYMVRSTYRFLIKRKNLNKFENAILDFIKKKTPKINSKKEANIAFKGFKEELLIVLKKPFEKKALDYFDFISWLDSKIENKKFAEIVSRSYNSHK